MTVTNNAVSADVITLSNCISDPALFTLQNATINIPSSALISAAPGPLGQTTVSGTVTTKPVIGAAHTYNIVADPAKPGTPNIVAQGGANPTVVATPADWSPSTTFGSTTSLTHTLDLGSSSAPISYSSITASTQTGGNWLSISSTAAGNTSGTGGYTAPTLTITANPTGVAAGVHNGSIVLNGASGSTVATIPVTFTVSAPAATLTVSPASLSFNHTAGTAAPPAQAVSVGGTGGISFTAAAATSTGGAWLSVTPTSGTVSSNISIAVNPAGLAAGTYAGSVTVTSAGATGSPATISVTLTVTAATLTVPSNPLTFTYTAGGSAPPAQSVSITGTPGLTYTASNGGTAWLTATPGGPTPSSMSVSVNPAGLAAGTHSGTVTVTSAGATGSPATIPVTLTVTAPSLTATPTPLNFNYQIGSTAPVAQNISVGGTPGLAFTAAVTSGGEWLAIGAPGGTVPATLSASVNTAGLAKGTYTGNIAVSASGATTQNVAVQLVVTDAPTLAPTPSAFTFTYQLNGTAPASQTLTLGGSAGLAYTLASDQSWLTVSAASGTTPGSATVSVNPAGLSAGTLTGHITVTSAGASNSPVSIPVTLTVSSATALTANPASLTFNYKLGGETPAAQSISIGGGSAVAYTVSAAGGAWLSVTPGSGSTPGSATVTVNPAGLTAGTYGATVSITSAGASNSPLTVPVNLVVSTAPTVTLSTKALSFSYMLGGANPATQTVNVTATESLAVTAAVSGANWLTVSSSSASTPAVLTIGVNTTGLTEGDHTGTITVSTPTASVTSQTITVSLKVSKTPAISSTPTSLTFTGLVGGSAPEAQTISVSGTAATTLTVTVTDAPWLTVTPSTGTTPATLTAAVNLAGLAAGTLNGTIEVKGTDANTLTIPVTLTVTAPTGPTIIGIREGAGFATDGYAPGSVISIFGTKMGPDPYVQFQLNGSGGVDNTLAGVKVTVDGTPAIPLLAWDQQINAIIPFSAKTTGEVEVIVEYNGEKSAPFKITMSPAAFKLFTINNQGTGPAAALNQDFIVNDQDHPAEKGSVVQLFGAGGGALSPEVVEGGVAPVDPLSWVTAPYSATVNGVDSKVWYAGTAPGLVFGVYQINVQLPADAATGAAKVVVKIGDLESQADITVFVK